MSPVSWNKLSDKELRRYTKLYRDIQSSNHRDTRIYGGVCAPATGRPLAWLRGGQECEGHWPPDPRPVQKVHTRNPAAPIAIVTLEYWCLAPDLNPEHCTLP